jgi:hypothetical protein
MPGNARSDLTNREILSDILSDILFDIRDVKKGSKQLPTIHSVMECVSPVTIEKC